MAEKGRKAGSAQSVFADALAVWHLGDLGDSSGRGNPLKLSGKAEIGVELEVIKSGEFKDIGSPNRKMTDREKEILLNIVEDIREQFVTAVSEGRSISKEKVLEIADGRIFSGQQAKTLGLVDSLGNFQDAVDLAKRMAGIKGEAKLVYPEEKRSSPLWDLLFSNMIDSIVKRIMRIWPAWVFLVLLVFSIAAYISGAMDADLKRTYFSPSTNPDSIVVRIYNDEAICVPLANNYTIKRSFFIMKMNEPNVIFSSREFTGKFLIEPK